MTSNGTPAIRTAGLRKSFGETKAVDGIDLEIPPGVVYGVLGPNGAGKSTLIRMLATLLRPDGGSASIFGHDVVGEADRVRRRISVTGQAASVDDALTGTENLILMGRLQGYGRQRARERAAELIAAFDLGHAADRLVSTYSGGMRRRLDIAASMTVTPDLLFLDEPTAGLDPRSRNQVWDIVRALVESGTTILLTTQYLEEADELAGRIAVVDHGRIIAEGPSSELKASVGSATLHVRLRDPGQRPRAGELLTRELGVPVRLAADPARLSAGAGDGARVIQALGALSGESIETVEFAVRQPSLDEVFLTLTGRKAEDAPVREESRA
ncbi:ATP-binding cassette domain-containing protein [Nonomuraea sp. MCN248]|uniref:ATP-binding cassette domain-containing protein n=1 Tax=Nonomuraea corallina TaxID=2989783 RepID=A0ABT4S6G8_9ACTN|nr:ATP-binding cassette domain-containing protein [Nonomuraea corallina]MDA0632784.1 ATP-binding cassette domain-containing protein [Nonomuraea corallina]